MHSTQSSLKKPSGRSSVLPLQGYIFIFQRFSPWCFQLTSWGRLTAGISSLSHSGSWRSEAAQPHSQPHSPLAGPCRTHNANASSSSSMASQSDSVQSSSSSIFRAPDPFCCLDGNKFSKNAPQWARLTADLTCQFEKSWENKRSQTTCAAVWSCSIRAPLLLLGAAPFQHWAVDTTHSSHMIPVSLCLSVPLSRFLSRRQGEELRPLPSSNPSQQVLYYHASSLFLFSAYSSS